MTDDLRRLAHLCLAADLESGISQGTWHESDMLEEADGFCPEDAAFIAAASPSAIIALLDRIEGLDAEVQERILAHDITFRQSMANGEAATLAEAERDEAQSEALEQARLLGMGAERELRLMAERDEARAAVKRLAGALELLESNVFEDGAPDEALELALATLQDHVVRRIVEE
jgi:hypothetical protein